MKPRAMGVWKRVTPTGQLAAGEIIAEVRVYVGEQLFH
jgi:hypothetical protein